MKNCECPGPHERKKIVLTGGPGAGKTATLELIRQSLCKHVVVLPESAGILFGGGFPRGPGEIVKRAAQRAIFFTQRELEATVENGEAAIVLCDRGTVDGAAYWPGPGDFFAALGTTRAEQHARYDAVIHMRTPLADAGYNQHNPLRIETPAEARAADERIYRAWEGHPHHHVIEATPDFLGKASHALELLARELPACCRIHFATAA